MKRRQWILLGLVAVAAVLAFALRDVVERSIIQPVAYLWWVLGLYYTAFPQLALWVTLVVVVAFLGLGTLTMDPLRLRRKRPEMRPVQGPVETLAVWMVKAPKGIYFKWLIAQRLGEDVKVDVRIVDSIAPEASGKHRYVVSHVPLQGELGRAVSTA